MANILPLEGKYYGTIIELKDGNIITIWINPPYGQTWFASTRELEEGWTIDYGFDHVETDYCYKVAKLIEDKLTNSGF